jgi:hypothetical protein
MAKPIKPPTPDEARVAIQNRMTKAVEHRTNVESTIAFAAFLAATVYGVDTMTRLLVDFWITEICAGAGLLFLLVLGVMTLARLAK